MNNPFYVDETITIHHGDSWELASRLEPQSINAIVTSPPYWGLRDYGHEGQFGLEDTPQKFVARLVDLFDLLRPALRDDGTVWLNLGDSYAGNVSRASNNGRAGFGTEREGVFSRIPEGLKSKDLAGIPWRVAFALQDAGWYLRQDIIWAKPNPMPESVTDRCTKSHEYLFLLSKSPRYYFDHEAIKEPTVTNVGDAKIRFGGSKYGDSDDPKHKTKSGNVYEQTGLRNKRDVWTIPAKPFKGAHFAVMPEALVEPCILAGVPQGGTVLDPFMGSGTTISVANRLGRNSVGFELNSEYIDVALQCRLSQGAFTFVDGEAL